MSAHHQPATVVIVADQPVGIVLARPFLQAGAKVVLVAGEDSPGHPQARHEVEPRESIEIYKVDLSDHQAVRTKAIEFVRRFGSIDVWVNVPRRSSAGAATGITLDQWDSGPLGSLRAAFNCCQAAGLEMVSAGRGVIINVTSTLGWHPVEGACSDATLASGIIGLTKALGVEWAPRGIRVVGVATGGNIETELLVADRPVTGLGAPGRTPLRTPATLDDVADAVFYLASDKASYVVAEILRVDGGWSAYQMF